MAEWLRRLTRNQMGLPAQVRILLNATFFAHLYSAQRPTFRKSEIKKNIQFLEKEEESHKTIQDRMTDTDKTRDSEMQSWRSADGVWIEIRYVHPAQVPILLTVAIVGPDYLFYEPIGTCQKTVFTYIPEKAKPHSSSTFTDRIK